VRRFSNAITRDITDIEFYNLARNQTGKDTSNLACDYYVTNPLFLMYCADGNIGIHLISSVLRPNSKILPERTIPGNKAVDF
jgi:hypothetical protein